MLKITESIFRLIIKESKVTNIDIYFFFNIIFFVKSTLDWYLDRLNKITWGSWLQNWYFFDANISLNTRRLVESYYCKHFVKNIATNCEAINVFRCFNIAPLYFQTKDIIKACRLMCVFRGYVRFYLQISDR